MKKNEKQLKEKLTKMANDFVELNYKKKAMEEIEKAKKGGFEFPNTLAIIDNYLDFDTVQLNIMQPKLFRITIALAPEIMKEKPKVVKELVKTFGKFYKGE